MGACGSKRLPHLRYLYVLARTDGRDPVVVRAVPAHYHVSAKAQLERQTRECLSGAESLQFSSLLPLSRFASARRWRGPLEATRWRASGRFFEGRGWAYALYMTDGLVVSQSKAPFFDRQEVLFSGASAAEQRETVCAVRECMDILVKAGLVLSFVIVESDNFEMPTSEDGLAQRHRQLESIYDG